MKSVPLFPYVLAMYMLCTSTGSNSLVQLILSHCKKCYWAVKSCTATKPLMVKQHLHVWVWVCGQLTAKCYCVWHMQFNTVGSSEPDLHNGYIKMLPRSTSAHDFICGTSGALPPVWKMSLSHHKTLGDVVLQQLLSAPLITNRYVRKHPNCNQTEIVTTISDLGI